MVGRWLGEEGTPVKANNVLITSGAIQGLYLLAKTLLEPGDPVVVECPTFMGGLQIFRAAGARLIDIPLDDAGMRVDLLENFLARQRPKFIYSLPTFQNPSGATLSLERRKKILDLAYQHQVPVIEEDPYSKIYFKDPPPPSLKALDKHNHVIYVGTFSKMLFPGLRIGWVTASRSVIERLAWAKQHIDLHSNSLGQRAIYEFCR